MKYGVSVTEDCLCCNENYRTMKKLATVEAVTSVTIEIAVFMGVMSCSLVKFIKLSKELTALILKVARRQ
jgi:hypothetical protein